MFGRTGKAGRRRPQLVIAHSDPGYVVRVARAFRRHGWVAAVAADGPEARQLAHQLDANLLVLEADLPGESGWLSCAKINLGGRRPPVVLVVGQKSARAERFAEVAGAARLVTAAEGAEPLLEEAGIAVAA
jgi:DNA-binding response OmpR family regulator